MFTLQRDLTYTNSRSKTKQKCQSFNFHGRSSWMHLTKELNFFYKGKIVYTKYDIRYLGIVLYLVCRYCVFLQNLPPTKYYIYFYFSMHLCFVCRVLLLVKGKANYTLFCWKYLYLLTRIWTFVCASNIHVRSCSKNFWFKALHIHDDY